MKFIDLVKFLQTEMNAQGENLLVDGDPGPKTRRALQNFDVGMVVSKKPQIPILKNMFPHPIDWARGELGQKEILGKEDNPRIRWYHTHCANIGSKEHPDEVPWCSSFLNACADSCGMEKTNNALASSWDRYGLETGDEVKEGDIVTIKSIHGRHVTLANRPFNRKTDKTFEGLGGNQGNMVKVSKYSTEKIVACRQWLRKPGIDPIMYCNEIATTPTGSLKTDENESTR